MEFKLWFEMIELRAPSAVKRKSVVKDAGTNVATRVTQYHWKTSIGNAVKLQFEPKGDRDYLVIFYVNNVLFDAGSRLMGTTRDPEILPAVFYLLKTKANALNAMSLRFTAYATEGDTKVVRGLNLEPTRSDTLQRLQDLCRVATAYEVKMVPPSSVLVGLHAKLNRPYPEHRPDVNVSAIERTAGEAIAAITASRPIGDLLNTFLSSPSWEVLPFDWKGLLADLQRLNNVVRSHEEGGWARTSNRRQAIYKKILDRDFSADWNIGQSGTSFTLTRK